MEFIFLNLFAAELIALCISILLVNQCSKRLAAYLNSSHREFQFLEKNLSAPYWAGDWTVMSQHFSAIRNAYFAKMPDEASGHLQKKMRLYGALSLFLFVLSVGTFIGSALILIGQKSTG